MVSDNSRLSFTLKRKKWFLKRDKNKCQAPFPHICRTGDPLQIHHIKPHGYINRVAPEISADFPENGLVLCRTAHEMIHPDVVWARLNYHRDNNIFSKLRRQRNMLMDNRKIYWVDTWDRLMEIVALRNTRRYEKKHPFPVYTKRRKHEKTEIVEDTED